MKKIIHRSPTQVIYEDGTSKRFKRTPKTEKLAGEPIKIPVIETGINHLIPVRDEDVKQFRVEMTKTDKYTEWKETNPRNFEQYQKDMDKRGHEYLGKRLVGRHGAKVLKEVSL